MRSGQQLSGQVASLGQHITCISLSVAKLGLFVVRQHSACTWSRRPHPPPNLYCLICTISHPQLLALHCGRQVSICQQGQLHSQLAHVFCLQFTIALLTCRMLTIAHLLGREHVCNTVTLDAVVVMRCHRSEPIRPRTREHAALAVGLALHCSCHGQHAVAPTLHSMLPTTAPLQRPWFAVGC